MLLSPQPFRAKVRCCLNDIDTSRAPLWERTKKRLHGALRADALWRRRCLRFGSIASAFARSWYASRGPRPLPGDSESVRERCGMHLIWYARTFTQGNDLPCNRQTLFSYQCAMGACPGACALRSHGSYTTLLMVAQKSGNGRFAARLSIPSPEGRGL